MIIAANFGQDQIRYQIRHPHFHFDSNAFEASYDYVEKQRQMVLDTLATEMDAAPAWQAFGRLIHTVQDFYAHSNYVQLWLDASPQGEALSPDHIGALDPKILRHPNLHSGKIYFWDWVSFIPGFYSLAYRMVPKDSHTHMNLDHPRRGPLFPYAIEAAIQRTAFEFGQITAALNSEMHSRFVDG